MLHKVAAFARIFSAALALAAVVAGAAWWLSELKSNVSYVQDDVRDVKGKTNQLLIDSARTNVRIDNLQRQTDRMQIDVDRLTTSRKK